MEKIRDEVWTTKEGKKINVGDMDIDHLRNVLRMILRNSRTKVKNRKKQIDKIVDGLRIVENEFCTIVGDEAWSIDFWKD